MSYIVFTRTWWRKTPDGRLEPRAGRKHVLRRHIDTIEEAISFAASGMRRTIQANYPVKRNSRIFER